MAEITAFFLSENWLKTRTPINSNVSIELIVPFIATAQDLVIQPLVGTALYERLMAGIVAANLSTIEMQLLDLIRPALAYSTLATALPFVATAVRNGGVVKTKSDQTDPATKAEVDALKAAAENMSEFYQQRVVRFLCDNSSSFPLYASSQDIAASSASPYTGGFFFGDGSCSCDGGLNLGSSCGCS